MTLEDDFGSNERLVDRMRRRNLEAPDDQFPSQRLSEALHAHPKAEVMWAQQRPGNIWHFVARRAGIETGVTTGPSIGPASGSSKTHIAEQQDLFKRALS
jgi:2-oxoglutarate dehydrogenase E1 component